MHNQTEVVELKTEASDVIMDGRSECAIVVTVAYPSFVCQNFGYL